MRVKPLETGPIIGHTTSSSVRIWGRGEVKSSRRFCHGVVRMRKKGNQKFGAPVVFKLNPNFDYTGITEISGLKASTEYEFQVGYVIQNEIPDAASLKWERASRGTLCTLSEKADDPVSFIFGSCRYMLRLGPLDLFDSRGDKIFRTIQQKRDGGDNTDFILMVGDQIYADDLNIISPDTKLSSFYSRYRTVFGQPHFKTVTSSLPTYMILDDHEIEDNWPEKAIPKDYRTMYPSAMHAYQAYQYCHSPGQVFADGKPNGTPQHYWYHFSAGCADFFVMDVRTERKTDKRLMVRNAQLQALKDWLDHNPERPKFITSSVPFAPDQDRINNDKWSGYHTQRLDILEYIRVKGHPKVSFLSGDIHMSMGSVIRHHKDDKFQVRSIISSPFFWPYPHGDPDDYLKNGENLLETDGLYYTDDRSDTVVDDNYTRVTCSTEGIQADVIGRKGEQLMSFKYDF